MQYTRVRSAVVEDRLMQHTHERLYPQPSSSSKNI